MISGLGDDDVQIKQVVSQMSLDPRVLRVDWSAADDDDIEVAD